MCYKLLKFRKNSTVKDLKDKKYGTYIINHGLKEDIKLESIMGKNLIIYNDHV